MKRTLLFLGLGMSSGALVSAQADLEPPPPAPPVIVLVPGLQQTPPLTPFALGAKTGVVPLRNVLPSVMAFWLDPKNHPAPGWRNAPGTMRAVPGVPAGIKRLVPDDARWVLSIEGTEEDVARLRSKVELVDSLNQPRKGWTFTCTAFWVDALALDVRRWGTPQLQLQSAPAGEVVRIKELVRQDRAAAYPLPLTLPDSNGQAQAQLPFTPAPETKLRPNEMRPSIPNLGEGGQFESQMPRLRGGVDVDPEFVPNLNRPRLDRTTLRIVAPQAGNRYLMVYMGDQMLAAPLSEEKPVFLFGSAQAFGLTPPTPRFGALVLQITPQVADSTP